MIVCPKEKIVFMNIPKTGTRSVLKYFQDNMEEVQQHGHRVNPPKQFLTDEYFRFATIRNPYDRIVSHYWAMMRRGSDRYGYVKAAKQRGYDNSLKSYLLITIDDVRSRRGGYRSKTGHPFNPQMTYIEDKNVHQLIHIENLNEEFNTLPFVKEHATLSHVNATSKPNRKNPNYVPRPRWQDIVGGVEADMINDLCKDDFAAFPEYEKI